MPFIISLFLCIFAAVPAVGISCHHPGGLWQPESHSRVAFRVAVISDLNGEYGSVSYDESVHSAVQKILAERPDLVLIPGDMVAGETASLSDTRLAEMWRAFHAAVTAPFTRAGIPVAVAPGNHDASGYQVYERERALYRKEWLARKPSLRFLDDSRYPFEYAFEAGGALFMALDQTTLAKLSPERLAWVDKVLSGNYEFAAKIVFAHIPLFPFTQGREKEATLDTELEALLVRHGVTVVISGHHHGYYPARRGALRYIGLGCLGNGPRKLIGDSKNSSRSMVWLAVTPDGRLDIEAYAFPGFSGPIARESLPASVGGGALRYVRDDLVP